MRTKHTPGPWIHVPIAGKRGFTSRTISGEGGNNSIAYVWTITKEGEANAKLIAATPELLEALTLIIKHFPTDVINDQMGEDAEIVFNAIKKATE